jgi:hypothetical protein
VAAGCEVPDRRKLLAKRKRVVTAFMDENIDEAEYRRRLSAIDGQLQAAQPADLPAIEEAKALLADLPALWAEATGEERQRLISSMIDRVYVDIEERCIAAIAPTPGFGRLLDAAIEQDAQSMCILVGATEDVDWAEWWTWWRRGRSQLQHLHHNYRVVHPPRPEWGAFAVLWRDSSLSESKNSARKASKARELAGVA